MTPLVLELRRTGHDRKLESFSGKLQNALMLSRWKEAENMLKAVLQNGAIVPLEPLPIEWEDGSTLEVAKAGAANRDIEAWAKFMDRLCADSPAEDEASMQAAIDEHRRQAKAQTRRDMGLPE
jgi:hypothetical protein